ncbi:MAG TPA: HIRAN domain-containing protein [Pirellulales bacterium]|nr:HIRAN domain-containing protein [Pirellulales bacterium]
MNSLFVAWRPGTPQETGWRPIGRLEHDGQLYRFYYTRGAVNGGFRAFAQMEQLDQVYESESLFPVFANRLLPSSRPEYEAYLRWSGFDPDNPPDPIVVLGVTEGIRQTDAIEVFPCAIPDGEGCYLNKFFLHGVRLVPRWAIERINELQPGDKLCLMPDLQNPVDPRAVAVRTDADRVMVGYVPRYLAHDAGILLSKCDVYFVELVVDRVNHDAPLQNRLLCRMRGCWPDGFRPCSSEEFAPIPAVLPADCVASEVHGHLL